jgi:hypothetical protein
VTHSLHDFRRSILSLPLHNGWFWALAAFIAAAFLEGKMSGTAIKLDVRSCDSQKVRRHYGLGRPWEARITFFSFSC